MNKNDEILRFLKRATDALEYIAGNKNFKIKITEEDSYIWNPENFSLEPIKKLNYLKLDLLIGIEHNKKLLLDNTIQFSQSLPANNVLLWGARGMGKSSLIKSVFKNVTNKTNVERLILIEINREDIKSIPMLTKKISNIRHQFILFCDDLSFDENETSYKSLKNILEGGLAEKSNNIIFYATSNKRHLISRNMNENESTTDIIPHEAVEEKVSLSDRFGLWLGFYQCSQEQYLSMVQTYIKTYNINIDSLKAKELAIEWSITRGSRSGRVAWQFIQDLAGKMEKKL